MTEVDIEYCVPCGHLDRAEEVQHALLSEYGRRLDGVRLTTGDGGVFVVSVDDDVVYDKGEGDEYDVDAITADVGERVE